MGALVLGTLGSGAPSCCTLEWSIKLGQGTAPTTTASTPPVPQTPEQKWACRATGTHAAKATAAANAAILALPTTIRADEVSDLGFNSPDDLEHASAGVPLCVFVLPVPALALYSPDKPLRGLLVERHALYPIEVSGQVRTGMIIEPEPPAPAAGNGLSTSGEWVATAYGGTKSVERFTRVRRLLSQQRSLPPSRFFIVEIAGLDLAFVAHEEQSTVHFTRTTQEVLEKVPVQRSEEVLQALQALVKGDVIDKPPLDE